MSPGGAPRHATGARHEPEVAALLHCLSRPDPLRPAPETAGLLARADPERLLLLARRHRVAVGLALALRDVDLDPVLREGLRRDLHVQTFRMMQVQVDLATVAPALDAVGCAWAVVKGPVTAATSYPRPDLRTYGDLDVLVPPTALPAVLRALEAAGAVLAAQNWPLVAGQGRTQMTLVLPQGTILDLHWHLLNRRSVREAFHWEMPPLLAGTRRLGVGTTTVPALDPSAALVHQSVHALLAGGDRLSWLWDLHLSWLHAGVDPEQVVREATAGGLGLATRVMLARSARVLGTPVPREVLAALSPEVGWPGAVSLLERLRPVPTWTGGHVSGRTVARSTRSTGAASTAALGRALWRQVALPVLRDRNHPWRGGPLLAEDDQENVLYLDVGGPQAGRALAQEVAQAAARPGPASAARRPGAASPRPEPPPGPRPRRRVRADPTRVLMRPAPGHDQVNPYVPLLGAALADQGVRVAPLSLRSVLREPPAVLHVHWPEANLSHRRTARAAWRTTKVLLLLAAGRARGSVVVWTAHNLGTHERTHPGLEQLFWRVFPRLPDAVLSLTGAGVEEVRATLPRLRPVPTHVTPHGHYRDVYEHGAAARARGRAALGLDEHVPLVLFAGHVRRYKNVGALVAAFQALDLDAHLAVLGGCHDAALAAEITEQVGDDPRTTLRLAPVPAEELGATVAAADLVVLPFQDVFNSGSAVLALSADRPLLLPESPAFAELAALAGDAWVRTYRPPLTPAVLADALAWATSPGRPTCCPLPGMDWPSVARRTAAAYRATAGMPAEPSR